MKIMCYTSFTFSYLTRALVLVRTLRLVHSDWEIWALLVDVPPDEKDFSGPLSEFDHVLFAPDLSFDRYEGWLFKHDLVEACTAVKGQMMRFLLDKGADKVIYFDPDIAIFNPISNIIDALDHSSIILTPHQVVPNETEGAVRDNELTSLKYGVYNLGFAAIHNDRSGRQFADWWAKQLYFACYDDISNGVFTDQKWCDLVPALFSDVYIERDPGCNVASWNLSTRRISITNEGQILVNGSPLKFYHYTKINSEGDLMTEKYAGDNIEVMEVWEWYKRAISKIVVNGIPKGYWFYGSYDNGVKIKKKARLLYRERSDLFDHFKNPFVTTGDSFFKWLESEYPEGI